MEDVNNTFVHFVIRRVCTTDVLLGDVPVYCCAPLEMSTVIQFGKILFSLWDKTFQISYRIIV
jgi:hypothetical protein